MLVEGPIGNVHTDSPAGPIDWIDLTWSQCHQRALRKHTRGGRPVRLLLGLGVSLRHGDILDRGEPVVAVNLLPEDVIVATPATASACGELCYELGSLHAPVQLDGHDVLTICDGPVEGLLQRLGIAYQIASRRFEPTLLPTGQVVISEMLSVNRRPASEQRSPEKRRLHRS